MMTIWQIIGTTMLAAPFVALVAALIFLAWKAGALKDVAWGAASASACIAYIVLAAWLTT